jgi:hypothetical protein
MLTTLVATAVPQRLVTEYDIVAVPTTTPTTMPGPEIMALPLLEDHVPPETVLVSVIPAPTHTFDGPDIVPATGGGTTVMILKVEIVPQTFVTV